MAIPIFEGEQIHHVRLRLKIVLRAVNSYSIGCFYVRKPGAAPGRAAVGVAGRNPDNPPAREAGGSCMFDGFEAPLFLIGGRKRNSCLASGMGYSRMDIRPFSS